MCRCSGGVFLTAIGFLSGLVATSLYAEFRLYAKHSSAQTSAEKVEAWQSYAERGLQQVSVGGSASPIAPAQPVRDRHKDRPADKPTPEPSLSLKPSLTAGLSAAPMRDAVPWTIKRGHDISGRDLTDQLEHRPERGSLGTTVSEHADGERCGSGPRRR